MHVDMYSKHYCISRIVSTRYVCKHINKKLEINKVKSVFIGEVDIYGREIS